MKQLTLATLLQDHANFLIEANKIGVDVTELVLKNLVKHWSTMDKFPFFNPDSNTTEYITSPTFHEINLGRESGKLAAIKAYKERTGQSLMDAKRNVERYFETMGYKFK